MGDAVRRTSLAGPAARLPHRRMALGVATIGLYLRSAIISFVSDDPSQNGPSVPRRRLLLRIVPIGVFSIVFVMRPDRIAVWHVLVAQALAYLFGGLMGGDLISGFWITGVVGLILLGVFAPDRRAPLRLPGHPSVALLTYALLCSIPAWIYAVMNAELQRLGSPSDPHVELHHLVGVAIAALALAGAALAASLRGEGWRFANAVTAVAAVGLRHRWADLPLGPWGSRRGLVVARASPPASACASSPASRRGGRPCRRDLEATITVPPLRAMAHRRVHGRPLVFVLERLVMRRSGRRRPSTTHPRPARSR